LTKKSRPVNERAIKAGALLCPVCCVELIDVKADFDLDGEVLHDVKILRCPVCQEEQLGEQQYSAVEKKISALKHSCGMNP
jgi:hypothetical protein